MKNYINGKEKMHVFIYNKLKKPIPKVKVLQKDTNYWLNSKNVDFTTFCVYFAMKKLKQN